MGYALLEATTDPPRLIDRGLVGAFKGGSGQVGEAELARTESTARADQLRAIADALDDLILLHEPGALAIERLYFNKNARTAMAVAEARGVALLCASRAGLEVAEYTPQEVKQSVTGSGGADKKQVQRMVQALLALDVPIKQDNVADAVAIGLTHLRRARFAQVLSLATP